MKVNIIWCAVTQLAACDIGGSHRRGNAHDAQVYSVEKSNAAINDGSLGRTMESILTKLKPEAAYFAPLDGKRAGMIFFDMAEPSQIIEAVEPLFLSLNATTELVPVMNADDLRKGLAKVAGK